MIAILSYFSYISIKKGFLKISIEMLDTIKKFQ